MKNCKLTIGLLTLAVANTTVSAATNTYVGSYDPNVDYRQAMYRCATLGDECSMAMGQIYEIQRNMKLTDLHRESDQTCYFHPGKPNTDIMTEMVADKMRSEHKIAAYVYERLSKAGYTDIAISGILGNMMNETGGNTLDLNPYVYEVEFGMHYGLCQWAITYFPEINGAGVETQLDYLINTIDKNMSLFGGSEEGLNACTTPEEAGEYFSTYYERGGNTEQRKKNARIAYKWIMSFKEV